jgi:predicted CXXCH cytochrome family protein
VAENCLNCHEPHGSNHEKLLVVDRPRLCQRCHIEARHPTTPQLAITRFAFNRSCQNCHSQIHGSNSPSGVRFHR